MSIAIDSLDNDDKLHIGIISIMGNYICIAQKYINSNFASGLVFGYSNDKLLYQSKFNGSWKAVREI